MAHILIVEDETHIAQMIEATLTLGGHTSQWCADGAQALSRIEEGSFDLALLDVLLPGLDGFSIMSRIQKKDIQVIFLSAMQQVEDKVRGLRLGAEDYIAKPFEPLELLARIEVALRRRDKGDKVLEYGPIRQELGSHTVTLNGEPVALSPKEFDLLQVFLQHQNLALSRDKLLAMVWGYEYTGESRTVDIHVQRLRQKLGLTDCLITLPRIGYRLEKLS